MLDMARSRNQRAGSTTTSSLGVATMMGEMEAVERDVSGGGVGKKKAADDRVWRRCSGRRLWW